MTKAPQNKRENKRGESNAAGAGKQTSAKVVPLRQAKCPICAKPVEARFQPFCSRRCADLDLGRWLDGSYAIPTDEAPAAQDDREDEF